MTDSLGHEYNKHMYCTKMLHLTNIENSWKALKVSPFSQYSLISLCPNFSWSEDKIPLKRNWDETTWTYMRLDPPLPPKKLVHLEKNLRWDTQNVYSLVTWKVLAGCKYCTAWLLCCEIVFVDQQQPSQPSPGGHWEGWIISHTDLSVKILLFCIRFRPIKRSHNNV